MPSPLRRRSTVPPYSPPLTRRLLPVSRKPAARRPAISSPDPLGVARTASERATAALRATAAIGASPRQEGHAPSSVISRLAPRTSTAGARSAIATLIAEPALAPLIAAAGAMTPLIGAVGAGVCAATQD